MYSAISAELRVLNTLLSLSIRHVINNQLTTATTSRAALPWPTQPNYDFVFIHL